jgi:hypothetical protein
MIVVMKGVIKGGLCYYSISVLFFSLFQINDV